MSAMNGEKWRILTPIFLMVLSVMATFNVFTLNQMSGKIDKIESAVTAHIQDPNIHYTTKKDVEWIKRYLRIKDAEASMPVQSPALESHGSPKTRTY